jgi:hypothetical protein
VPATDLKSDEFLDMRAVGSPAIGTAFHNTSPLYGPSAYTAKFVTILLRKRRQSIFHYPLNDRRVNIQALSLFSRRFRHGFGQVDGCHLHPPYQNVLTTCTRNRDVDKKFLRPFCLPSTNVQKDLTLRFYKRAFMRFNIAIKFN